MKDRISQEIKNALKNGEALRLSTLRMFLAELQRKEKEKGIPVDASSSVQILQSMVRKRKEAIEQFNRGGREDLATKELEEIAILKEFLPEQLSEEEVRQQARSVIAELGARGPGDMGKVMGRLMKKVAGRADGGTVNRIVKEELQTS